MKTYKIKINLKHTYKNHCISEVICSGVDEQELLDIFIKISPRLLLTPYTNDFKVVDGYIEFKSHTTIVDGKLEIDEGSDMFNHLIPESIFNEMTISLEFIEDTKNQKSLSFE